MILRLSPFLFFLIFMISASVIKAQGISDAQYEQLRQALMKDKGHLSQGWDNVFSGNVTSCSDSSKESHHPGVDYGGEDIPVYSPISGTVINIRQGADCQDSTKKCLSLMAIYNAESDKTYIF